MSDGESGITSSLMWAVSSGFDRGGDSNTCISSVRSFVLRLSSPFSVISIASSASTVSSAASAISNVSSSIISSSWAMSSCLVFEKNGLAVAPTCLSMLK